MTRILVTGATGFVGRPLCNVLGDSGHVVRAAVRTRAGDLRVAEQAVVGPIGPATEWDEALKGVDCIVHAAARAHVMNDPATNAGLYDEVNHVGTRRLAEAAVRNGVRRMVFVSSIKVNGEETTGRAYDAADVPRPVDPYGQSKWEGEQRLREIASSHGLEAVVVRPPLVYGPGVRANFLRLLRWVDAERMLPFGSIDNRRSLVSLWNLCDFLRHVCVDARAANRTWLVSDHDDRSTPDLIRAMAAALERRARLLPIPVAALRALGAMTGKSQEIRRLCGSLCVNVKASHADLGWSPPLSFEKSLERTAQWYLAKRRADAAS